VDPDPEQAFHFNADQDPAFHFNADPDLDPASYQIDGNLCPLIYRLNRVPF
jgi:hypothetical protein